MAHDEIEKILKELRELGACIKKTDAKLDGHIIASNAHWQTTKEHMEKMEPGIKFLDTMSNLNRFFKWGGLTLFGAIALAYWLIKKS
jgi:hypothetical protein